MLESIVDESQKRCQITKNDLELIKILGVGAYGKVALVKHKASGKRFAMKQLKIKEIERRNQHKYIMEERRILEKSSHPFVCGMPFAFKTRTKLTFVLDYCPGGELFFYL
jgi:serine/threonine protein kinase